MDTILIVFFAGIAVAAVAFIYWMYTRQKQEREMVDRFGPEYHRARVGATRADAINDLRRRQQRVESFKLMDLDEAERSVFSQRWRDTQAAFVDNPSRSLDAADKLVGEVMVARGYPMEDFEERADDLSVGYPKLVGNYRTGHEVAIRNQRGDANTEDLRQAFICYRAMFDELLQPTRTAGRETATAGSR